AQALAVGTPVHHANGLAWLQGRKGLGDRLELPTAVLSDGDHFAALEPLRQRRRLSDLERRGQRPSRRALRTGIDLRPLVLAVDDPFAALRVHVDNVGSDGAGHEERGSRGNQRRAPQPGKPRGADQRRFLWSGPLSGPYGYDRRLIRLARDRVI